VNRDKGKKRGEKIFFFTKLNGLGKKREKENGLRLWVEGNRKKF
jgi:hypothetical protein